MTQRILLFASVAVALGLSFASPSFAMLPPYWDRVSQMNAVIQSPEVAAKFGDEIESVRRDGELKFTVASPACAMQVTLKAISASPIGPTTYSIDQLGPKVCN